MANIVHDDAERPIASVRICRWVPEPGDRRESSGVMILQPWGKDRGRKATVISEHATVLEAFAANDALSAQIRKGRRARTKSGPRAIQL